MSPVVSVIMPFLDAAPYIDAAIDSVRRQTFADWELILVDDGSCDGSAAIAASRAAEEPRIRMLRSGGRRGPAAARNLGLAHAAGEFIAFLDADDLFEPAKLATEIAILRRNPEAAMLYGPVRWWHPDAPSRDIVENLGTAVDRIHPPPHLAARILLQRKGIVPCTCGVLIRRLPLLTVGGFEESFRLYEDQTLWAKLFLRYPVFVSAHPLSRYRQHGASTSAQAMRSGRYHPLWRHAAERRFLEWLSDYIETNGVENPELARAVERALSPYRRRSAAARRTIALLGARLLARLTQS